MLFLYFSLWEQNWRKFGKFGKFIIDPRKLMHAKYFEIGLPRKFMSAKNIKPSHPRKFLSAKVSTSKVLISKPWNHLLTFWSKVKKMMDKPHVKIWRIKSCSQLLDWSITWNLSYSLFCVALKKQQQLINFGNGWTLWLLG